MELTTTFRSFNGSIYVRVPPAHVEYNELKEKIVQSNKQGTEPECKIEDKDKNKLLVTFPKW